MWYTKFVGVNKVIDYGFRKAIDASIILKLKCRLHKDIKYYIIRKPHPAGFFSDYFYVLGHCMIAEKLGLKPYIDMETYPSLYSEEHKIDGTNNAWEYFFRQDIQLNEVLSEPYIICEEKYPYGRVPYYSTTCLGKEGTPNRKIVKRMQGVLLRYAEVKEDIYTSFEKWGGDIVNCVGVHIRGTDMKHTAGHFVPKGVSEVIEYIARVRVQRNIKKIFLCSDEKAIIEEFTEAFKNRIEIVYANAYRSEDNIEGVHLEKKPHTARKNHKYLLGYEVLRDAYLLSKCKALVYGKSNVAYAAIVMNNNRYEWMEEL